MMSDSDVWGGLALAVDTLGEVNAMGHMKGAEAQYAKQRASIRSVMIQFAYDFTVKLWRVVFRLRARAFPCPA